MLTIPQPFGGLVIPRTRIKPASIVHTDNVADAANGSAGVPYSWASRSIGTEAGRTHIIVGAGYQGAFNGDITGVTVGGNAATLVGSRVSFAGQGGFMETALWIIASPAGTTATITLTCDVNTLRASIGVWAAYDLLSATPTDVGSAFLSNVSSPSALTDNLDIAAGGIAVGYVHGIAATAQTFTFSNLTEAFDETIEAGVTQHAGGQANFAAAQSGLALSITPNVVQGAGASFASFR